MKAPLEPPPLNPNETYAGVKRLINCSGRSSVVAQFKAPMTQEGQPVLGENGEQYQVNRYIGKGGLRDSGGHPEAAHALNELMAAEKAIRRDPSLLGKYPSASGNEQYCFLGLDLDATPLDVRSVEPDEAIHMTSLLDGREKAGIVRS
jgi:hypothetical protein